MDDIGILQNAEGNVDSSQDSDFPEPIKFLLQQFQVAFKEPKALPPVREVDHRIPLEPGAKLVNIRPYRYLHFQKIEMEKLVAKLQASGVIRDSRSLFSSSLPVEGKIYHVFLISLLKQYHGETTTESTAVLEVVTLTKIVPKVIVD